MKIYLSSTFSDLRDHRAAVDLALQRMGHDVIGMEQYVAENAKPLDRCVRDVASTDLYVVIVAWRYGHVPVDPVGNPDGYSITRLEFEAAKSQAKPILAFLLDPEAPWPPSRMDAVGSRGGDEVAGFRALLGSDYLAGVFQTADNLASQVAAAVSTQGLNRQMAERALEQRSVTDTMTSFGRGAPLADTTLAGVKDMISTAGAARTLLVDLDDGEAWWSTRLYLLAVLAATLTGIRQILFQQGSEFVGMASPVAVREGLRAAMPVLETFDAELRRQPGSKDVTRETQRTTALWAQRVTGSEPDIRVGVRPQLLAEWLGERLLTRCIRIDPEHGLTMVQIQQVVESLIPDVPIERRRSTTGGTADESTFMVVERDAFALELARAWVRSSLPRTPVR